MNFIPIAEEITIIHGDVKKLIEVFVHEDSYLLNNNIYDDSRIAASGLEKSNSLKFRRRWHQYFDIPLVL